MQTPAINNIRQPFARRGAAILLVFGLLILVMSAGTFRAADALEADIVDLLQSNKIAAEVRCEEIRTVRLRVRRLVPEPVSVRVPVGTLFVSKSGTVQNMVTVETLTLPLATGEWFEREVSVACTNLRGPIPAGDARLSIQRAPNQKALARVMPKLAGQDFAAQQAAAWIITDNARLRGLCSPIVQTRTFRPGRFDPGEIVSSGPLISPTDAARATRLCTEARPRHHRPPHLGRQQGDDR